MSRSEREARASTQISPSGNIQARDKWKRAGDIARRAQSDDTSSSESMTGLDVEERERRLQRKREAKADREKLARTMGLEYFLEMVSHLLVYDFLSLITYRSIKNTVMEVVSAVTTKSGKSPPQTKISSTGWIMVTGKTSICQTVLERA